MKCETFTNLVLNQAWDLPDENWEIDPVDQRLTVSLPEDKEGMQLKLVVVPAFGGFTVRVIFLNMPNQDLRLPSAVLGAEAGQLLGQLWARVHDYYYPCPSVGWEE